MNRELENKINSLENRLERVERLRAEDERKRQNEEMNTKSTSKTRDFLNEFTGERLGEVLWNRIYYLSSFAAGSVTTTASEVLSSVARISDTTGGLQFKPDRPSKFRIGFYILTNLNNSTVYIASPAVFAEEVIDNDNDSILDSRFSFVGIKIHNGVVTIVSSDRGVIEEKSTTFRITDDTTHIFEIDYGVTHAKIYIDNQLLGGIDCKLNKMSDFQTFLPLLTSVGSSNSSETSFTFDMYEFLQPRSL